MLCVLQKIPMKERANETESRRADGERKLKLRKKKMQNLQRAVKSRRDRKRQREVAATARGNPRRTS